ncbi:MAG: hypothetical protein IPG05_10710 [Gemmatimonadetes bacterium]|jgi:hypothetical protein|nr:hypothetical protein [Gemmatimonadota bacterium]
MIDFASASEPIHRGFMTTPPAPAAALDREFMSLREFAKQSGLQLKPLVVEAAAGLHPYARKLRAGGKASCAASWVVHLPTLRAGFEAPLADEGDEVAAVPRRRVASARQPRPVTSRASARFEAEAEIDWGAVRAATKASLQRGAAQRG